MLLSLNLRPSKNTELELSITSVCEHLTIDQAFFFTKREEETPDRRLLNTVFCNPPKYASLVTH